MLRILMLLALVLTLANFNLIAQASDSTAAALRADASGDIWLAIIIALILKPVLARLIER